MFNGLHIVTLDKLVIITEMLNLIHFVCADIYTALRLGDSCIGRGFFNNPCSQFGDPCTNDCTGGKHLVLYFTHHDIR